MHTVVLFIDGAAVIYSVQRKAGRYYFAPDSDLGDGDAPPFWAEKVDGTWRFEGVEDQNLMDQALEDLLRLTRAWEN